MRQLTWWLATSLALAALGCGGSNGVTPPAPLTPQDSPIGTGLVPEPGVPPITSVPASLGQAYVRGSLADSALALYTIDIDPSTLSATASLKATRSGQATDDLYLLPIDSFFNARSFRITGITGTATTVDIAYEIAHPFPAPSDVLGTPNAVTNRSDLGVAGKVLWLADVASASGNTFFSDRVANTTLIANADAYYAPGGLLTTSGTANTFPYKLLVDETLDGTGSRVGISNDGDVTGNFGTDGWTRDEYGTGNDGWTGYGVLHQGQVSRNVLSLSRGAISGSFSLDMAVIARYNDPRGGLTPAEKKANRLPPASADASLFAYRMPHGALDIQKVSFAGEGGGFIQDTLSASVLRFHVEDWDARATETTESDLSVDPSFTNVAPGESGAPSLAVSIPGVLGDATAVVTMAGGPVDDDSAYGGDVDQDSGLPGDPLFFSESVTKAAGSGQVPGTYQGLVRVTDVEATIADSFYVIELDGSLALVTANVPEPVTYFPFEVDLAPNNLPPSATVVLVSSNPLLSGTQPEVLITGIGDPDSDPLDISIDWGDGSGLQPLATGYTSPYAPLNPTGVQRNNATLTNQAINALVRVADAQHEVDYPVNFQLGPNRAPVLTGSPELASASLPVIPAALFTMNAGTAGFTDPEGDTMTLRIRNTANGNNISGAAFPLAGNTTGISSLGSTTFTVYVEDPLHTNTAIGQPNSAARWPGIVGTTTRVPGWFYKGVGQSTSTEQAYVVNRDSQNNVLIAGLYNGTTNNFGSGNQPQVGPQPSLFLVKLNPLGQFQWVNLLGASTSLATGIENLGGMAVDSNDNILLYGSWRGLMTLATGITEESNNDVLNASTDLFLVKFAPDGSYMSHWRTNTAGDANVTEAFGFNALVLDGSNNAYITGRFNRTEDFPTSGAPITLTTAHGAASASYDPFVARINTSSMTTDWATNFAMSTSTSTVATGTESGQSLAMTPFGQLVVGGYFRGPTTGTLLPDFGGGGRLVRVSSTSYAMSFITLRNASTGAWIWDRVFGATIATVPYVNGLAADNDRIYATGRYSNGTNFDGITDLPASTTATTNSDPYLAAFSIADGSNVWVNGLVRDAITAVNNGFSVKVSGGAVYAVGDFSNLQNLGDGFIATNNTSAYLIKRNAATGTNAMVGGNPYILTWNATGNDRMRSLAFDSYGDLFLCGEFTGNTFDADPGAAVNSHNSLSGSTDYFGMKVIENTASF